MAHFAEIDENNIVKQIIVVSNEVLLDENGIEQEHKGIEFCKNILGGNWVQTSYNSSFRKNFAGEGYSYDNERDAFIPPNDCPSWTFNEETCNWDPPTPKPNDGMHVWNEELVMWVKLT